MGFDEVRAQATAIKTLRKATQGDRVAGAYLFEGPSGVGKKLAALAFASALNCREKPGEGCGKCDICKRIRAGSHPDVRVYAPREEGNRNLQVEFLRQEVLPFCQFAPFEGGHAVIIFPEADVSFPMFHPEAANALLKTLEEPRKKIHFVLTTERSECLLATIRSRCQRIRFSRLPDHTVDTILEEQGVREALRPPAVALADGRADRALALAEDGAAEKLFERAFDFDSTLETAKSGTLVMAAERFAKMDDLPAALETLALLYRDVAVAGMGQSDEHLVFKKASTRIHQRAATLAPYHASQRHALLHEALLQLERNTNVELMLDSLFFSLKDAS